MTTPVPELRMVYFHLTEGCNLACRHCWIDPPFDPRHQKACLDPADYAQVLEEAIPLGLRDVKLTGGEPLLHPRILEILRETTRRDVGLSMETNGTLLEPEVVEELLRNRRLFVAVSLDGRDAGTHDAFRGVPGTFDRTVAGIRRLVEGGHRPQVIATLNRTNSDQIPELIQLVTELGAGSFKLNMLQPTARGAALHQAGGALTIPEVLELVRMVNQEIRPKSPIRIYADLPFAYRSLSDIHGQQGGRCGIDGIIGVIATGHYALCGIGAHVPDLVFGRIGEDPLKDVWSRNEIIQDIRQNLPEKLEGICSRCVMQKACRGTCLAQSYYRTGSLWSPYWFCEEVERQGLFPPTRLKPEQPATPSA